ncbi:MULTISPECIES: hypothetical protein [unclassified Brevibacterium]|uniref:hypothetical protein n=1 Tax=unclassified Brevibacterium TaxID=2614124 RepID=UPI0010C7AEE1|nr:MULTISPECIES: hypothetical protein [unclassified Brevibacterium]MCK1802964.1 hypothetical protein [Brevibacterium sp. R8603A2]QCP04201.1 hypothetical protein FDF13_01825 [Brevibacterium sp. CS2]
MTTVEDMIPGDWFALEDDRIGRVYLCLARPVEVGRRRHRLTPSNSFGHSTDLRVHRVTVWSHKPCRRLSEAEVVAALRDLRSRMLDPVEIEREWVSA